MFGGHRFPSPNCPLRRCPNVPPLLETHLCRAMRVRKSAAGAVEQAVSSRCIRPPSCFRKLADIDRLMPRLRPCRAVSSSASDAMSFLGWKRAGNVQGGCPSHQTRAGNRAGAVRPEEAHNEPATFDAQVDASEGVDVAIRSGEAFELNRGGGRS